MFNWLARIGLKLLVRPMRKWDYSAAQLPDILVANSAHTQKQIQKYYGRESVVIHPPVDTHKFEKYSVGGKREGFIAAGRQTPYKRIDLAVAVCSKLKLPLTVVGTGPENARLKKIAGPSVTFADYLKTPDEVAEMMASAKALIFPGLDDFGIVAVEALAAGTPVIAYKGGGALDYVQSGVNGEFFKPQSAAALAKVLSGFKPAKYIEKDIKKSAELFSIEAFRSKISKLVESL